MQHRTLIINFKYLCDSAAYWGRNNYLGGQFIDTHTRTHHSHQHWRTPLSTLVDFNESTTLSLMRCVSALTFLSLYHILIIQLFLATIYFFVIRPFIPALGKNRNSGGAHRHHQVQIASFKYTFKCVATRRTLLNHLLLAAVIMHILFYFRNMNYTRLCCVCTVVHSSSSASIDSTCAIVLGPDDAICGGSAVWLDFRFSTWVKHLTAKKRAIWWRGCEVTNI